MRLVYLERGYFKALVADPEIKIVQGNDKAEEIDVVISVDEGRQYRLKDISFTNGTVFPVAALRRQFPISSGDILDGSKISNGLENLRKLYGASGFIDFTPVPDTMIDEDAGLISLKIDIDEGRLFRWGELIVNGVESQPGAREKLIQAWQAYKGKPYDSGISLKHLLRDIHAAPTVRPEEIFETSKDEGTCLINVYLTLVDPPQELQRILAVARARSSPRHR